MNNSSGKIYEITGRDEPVIDIKEFLEDIGSKNYKKNYKMDFKAFLWLFTKRAWEQS